MQLIVVLCLIAKLALVSGDCDVGKTVKDLDFKKFTGAWYFLYYQPNEHDDAIVCPELHIGIPFGNISNVTTYAYDKSQRRGVAWNGHYEDWDNTGFTINYPQDLIWNGRSYVAAIQYDRYLIFKICSKSLNKVLTYVGFRSPHPDEATLKEVEKTLKDNNIDIEHLKYWSADYCAKF